MTPAARLQMAIEILEALDKTAQPTDRFLKAWFRTPNRSCPSSAAAPGWRTGWVATRRAR